MERSEKNKKSSKISGNGERKLRKRKRVHRILDVLYTQPVKALEPKKGKGSEQSPAVRS